MTFQKYSDLLEFPAIARNCPNDIFRKVNGNNGAHFHLRQFTLNGISVNDNNWHQSALIDNDFRIGYIFWHDTS